MFKSYLKTNKQKLHKITTNHHLFVYLCFFDFFINPSVKLYSVALQMIQDCHWMIADNFPITRYICPVWVVGAFQNGDLPFYSIFIYAAAFYLVWQLIDFLKTKCAFFKSFVSNMYTKTVNSIEGCAIDLVLTTSQKIEQEKVVVVVHKNINF